MQLSRLCQSLAVWVFAVFSPCILAAPEEVAVLVQVDGTVHVTRAQGKRVILSQGSVLGVGDVVSTEKFSYAKLRFADGSEMAVRPASSLVVTDYHFKETEPEKDAAAIRLLKGGLRTVTGLIGKRGHQDAYQLKGGAATIGIRGTEFVARLCSQDCQEGTPPVLPAGAAQTPEETLMPGLYTEVKSGSVVLQQDDGRVLLLKQGEVGFASPDGRVLDRLPAPPVFLQTDSWTRSMRVDPAACRTR